MRHYLLNRAVPLKTTIAAQSGIVIIKIPNSGISGIIRPVSVCVLLKDKLKELKNCPQQKYRAF